MEENNISSQVDRLPPPNLTAVCWRPARMSFYHRSDVPTLMLRKSGSATRLSNCQIVAHAALVVG